MSNDKTVAFEYSEKELETQKDSGVASIALMFAGLNAVYYAGESVYRFVDKKNVIADKVVNKSADCPSEMSAKRSFDACVSQATLASYNEFVNEQTNSAGISSAALVVGIAVASFKVWQSKTPK